MNKNFSVKQSQRLLTPIVMVDCKQTFSYLKGQILLSSIFNSKLFRKQVIIEKKMNERLYNKRFLLRDSDIYFK